MKKLGKSTDVAKRLDLPIHSVWAAARAGIWPFTVKISAKHYRFDMEALEDFIKNRGLFADEQEDADILELPPLPGRSAGKWAN